MTKQTTLRDVLPSEFFGGEYDECKANKYLDCVVVAEHNGGWMGTHKNVNVWWELNNGLCVGWNENPSVGYSFPISKKR
ncbi:hypothetical protein [Photobacterium damselae]|uniref:hypothetical protein n=1 Tax=Photobacterium damselae TaxID=38293 RepID=UPI001F4780DE|nr:hypothetical protein [Photobacterium damselae]UKA04824.1 hypothetical protein IHC89_21515 [Photobacterium damselae subsp. damselae]